MIQITYTYKNGIKCTCNCLAFVDERSLYQGCNIAITDDAGEIGFVDGVLMSDDAGNTYINTEMTKEEILASSVCCKRQLESYRIESMCLKKGAVLVEVSGFITKDVNTLEEVNADLTVLETTNPNIIDRGDVIHGVVSEGWTIVSCGCEVPKLLRDVSITNVICGQADGNIQFEYNFLDEVTQWANGDVIDLEFTQVTNGVNGGFQESANCTILEGSGFDLSGDYASGFSITITDVVQFQGSFKLLFSLACSCSVYISQNITITLIMLAKSANLTYTPELTTEKIYTRNLYE